MSMPAATMTEAMQSYDARKEAFLASLTKIEKQMFTNVMHNYMAKAQRVGKMLSTDQLQRCAAEYIHVQRTEGPSAASAMQLGKVPIGWPDVRVKQKRERKALPGQSEAEIQKAIIDYLKKAGWLVIRFNSVVTQEHGRFVRAYTIENSGKSAGVSDIIAFKFDRYLFLEVKTETGKLNPNQIAFRDLAQRHGCVVHVVRSVDETVRIAA